jgi:2-polyprenyl-6-hydroxyphenyl methylase/3-demethylubiquinone-9 3-methyltransferase
MRQLPLDPLWPDSWKLSHHYDQLEQPASKSRNGYVYTYRERWRRTLDLVRRAAPPPATVLDVAAAQGNFSLALAELGYDVTWNDLRAELADYVRLKYERGTLRYAPGNAFELGFRECFDIVLITEVIEHVAHPDQFLAQAAQMVRPGGHIVLTTPNGAYFRNPLPRFSEHPDPSVFESAQFQPDSDGHIFLLHEDEVRSLAKTCGLDVIDVDIFANALTNGHLKTGALLPALPPALVRSIERLTQRLPFRSRQHTSLAVLLRKR